MHTIRVYHHAWPGLQGEGPTLRNAATDLLRQACAESGCVGDGWHRKGLESILADIRAFLARPSGPDRTGGQAADTLGAGSQAFEGTLSTKDGQALGFGE